MPSSHSSLRERRAAVVTALGCVTPVGNDVRSFWRALLEGRSGAAPVRSFDASPFRARVGCEVKGFRLEGELEARAAGRDLDRASELAVAAGREALRMAGLEASAGLLERVAVSLGTTMGAPCFLDRLGEEAGEAGREAAPWAEVLSRSAFSMTRHLAEILGLGGPQVSLPAACSAGNYAIGFALDLIREGHASLVLAGGSEAFSESAFAGFDRLKALSPDVCRPFDRNRRGLLLGEGAGLLVLEREEHARRRGARPLARVLGYGLSCDAYHITGPDPEGEGALSCMARALEDARVGVEQVDYVCCHGTGTRANDVVETQAIRRCLGERADSVPVSSIKALTGHMMGAASAAEAIACVLALQEGVLPPTWNLEEQDPECDLDVIPNAPRPARARVVLNNSYAFGGNNACVAFGRV